MKKNLTLLILFLTVSAFAQKSYKNADKLFEQMRYVEAASVYKRALKNGDRSMQLLQKAGDSYYFNTNMVEANKWYDFLMSEYLDTVNPEYIFRYAHSLQGIGDFKNAKKWMKIFAKTSAKKDGRISDYAQNEQTLTDILNLPEKFELKNIDINTKYSDFGPAYFKSKLVYSSSIDTSFFIKRRYHWNEQPYLNFYVGSMSATQMEVTENKEFSKSLSTRFHEATLVFAENDKRVYFTRNNYNGNLQRDNDGVSNLKLYTAVVGDSLNVKEDWVDIQELPFNNDAYSVGHPALSTDGSKLYFVSDMPGSIGATDLFVVDILGDNTYSTPKNLGANINTSGREMFPFVRGNHLYFASDGHLGVGGLDVFVSDFTEDSFSKPRNLGKPLNSELDDFGFIINEEDERGFVCSNREGGKGDDDIYAFQRIESNEEVSDCLQEVKGYVTNLRTSERVGDAIIALYDNNDKKITQTQSKSNGDYSFRISLNCESNFLIKVEKTGYLANEKTFQTSAISSEMVVPLGLETIDKLVIEDQGLLKIKVGVIYFDLNKDYIRPDAAVELNKIVTLMGQQPNIKIRIESHTDSRSEDAYNLLLSERRAQQTKHYLIKQGISERRIVKTEGLGETQLLNDCTNAQSCGEAQHQINRRSEFIIVEM